MTEFHKTLNKVRDAILKEDAERQKRIQHALARMLPHKRGWCAHCEQGPVKITARLLCGSCTQKAEIREAYPQHIRPQTPSRSPKKLVFTLSQEEEERRREGILKHFQKERARAFKNFLGRIARGQASEAEIEGYIACLERLLIKKRNTPPGNGEE
ncbi:MAG: hypothetical protein KKB70_05280 [Proteobacteria bacterium]|nr:hypothetical protein [Pseudomonadota bacterium]